MFTKASIAALFATTVAAIGVPTTLTGNPIAKPGLNEIVPACKEYTITWQATSKVPVSIRLLRGPSENVVPLGEPLAVSIPNTGSFKWTPASTLEADTTHYGLQIIEDFGNYQYSTQFGISTDECKNAPKPSTTPSGYPTGKPSSTPSEGYPTETVNATSAYPTKISKTSSVVLSTGYPVANSSSIVQPTKSMSIPSSLKTTATSGPSGTTTSSLPESTGAASSIKVGFGLLGAAAFAFML